MSIVPTIRLNWIRFSFIIFLIIFPKNEILIPIIISINNAPVAQNNPPIIPSLKNKYNLFFLICLI